MHYLTYGYSGDVTDDAGMGAGGLFQKLTITWDFSRQEKLKTSSCLAGQKCLVDERDQGRTVSS